MNRQDTIAAINDIGHHKVTFTLSNLEVGSRYALINSATGEVVEEGTTESPEVNLYVNQGAYDVRVRKTKWLPFSCEDVYINNKGLSFHINQIA